MCILVTDSLVLIRDWIDKQTKMKKYIGFIFTAVVVFATAYMAQAQNIITVAGSGAEDYLGDKGKATKASLHWPESIALDRKGRLYIADSKNNCIRRVSETGEITTIVGNGFGHGTGYGAYSGDGAAATAAELFRPSGIALDTADNLFIADMFNHVIRRVDAKTGIITTIAGKNVAGFSGDMAAATAATLSQPSRIATDTFGNIYIADTQNDRIRKIDAGGIISTFAGTGVPGYSGDGALAVSAKLMHPYDVAADKKGNVYIVDELNNCVRQVDPGGVITTIAGTGIPAYSGDGGAATAARMYDPTGVAVDDSGNVFISDNGNAAIRKVNKLTGLISTYAGADTAGYNGDGRPATTARICFPQGLTLNSKGSLYITDQANNRIRFVGSATEGTNTINAALAKVNIYPNPAQGSFVVNIASVFYEQASVSIMSITGQQLYRAGIYTNDPNEIKFDAPPGVYIVYINTAHGNWSGRLVMN